jgi:hypothetical protein
MANEPVSPGQVWRADATGAHFLITRVYSDALHRFAVLRPVEVATGEQAQPIRLRIAGDPAHPLPGYTRESGEFNPETAE